jgi:NitT/TauT family transport system ATP-binding protein
MLTAQDETPIADEVHHGPILQLSSVRKVYGNDSTTVPELVVLNDITINVDEGEFVTIIGPSGCGKSTLLSIIAGLDSHQGGRISVNGNGNAKSTDAVMVFQEGALFPWLTVRENVEFGLKQKGVPAEERHSIAARYIEMVHLTQFANSYIHQLSGGMKQRVAIARALAMDPKILLMDEAFGALDARTREILHQIIQEIHVKTRKTILFVTHDVKEAVCLGDRVLIFSYRPARIKQQYVVDFPRPRNVEDPDLQIITRSILGELKEEVRLATRDSIRN